MDRQLTAYAESTFTLELMQDGKFFYPLLKDTD
jgi:hypothetical protein